MARQTVSPSTTGVRPNMHKMYDGRAATRPIPLIVDSSEVRAIAAAAADQKPKSEVVNFPSAPLASTAVEVFGTVVPGSARVRGGVFNPAVGVDQTI